MDHVTYDNDGNPIVGRDYRKRSGSRSKKSTNGGSDGANSMYPHGKANGNSTKISSLTGIFQIDGTGYDVVLTSHDIKWSSVSMGTKVPKSGGSSFFKRWRSNSSKHGDSSELTNRILLEDVIGVAIKRRRQASQKEGEGICLGVGVYSYERREDGRLKERLVLFGHPSDEVCLMWSRRIQQLAIDNTDRPKRVKVFLQPYAGKKEGRIIYKNTIKPLFCAANMELDETEVGDEKHVAQEIIKMDLSSYDSVVCVGGDGTANHVIGQLLNKLHADSGVKLCPGFAARRAILPVGIIPIGTTNHLVHSAIGTDDVTTATIHIILGNTVPVDVTSVYRNNSFLRWSFNSQYGFFANVLSHISRFVLIGERRLEAALMKALTRSKFRPYECEIEYLPSDVSPSSEGQLCRTGCKFCAQNLDTSRRSTFSDKVEFLNPLMDSNSSSDIHGLRGDGEGDAGGVGAGWKTVKGHFVNISVLSVAGMSDLCPLGLSTTTHLADGSLDLVLVRDTDRHEFVRFLRRHGNAKNQMALPFVETHRCREVRVRMRVSESWRHKDYDFSEINYEMTRQTRTGQRSRSLEVIDDLEPRDAAEEDGDSDAESDVTSPGNNSAGSRRTIKQTNSAGYVSSNYQPTLVEADRARRQKIQRKKDERNRSKNEARQRSCWSFDNEIYMELDLSFRIHPGLVLLHGTGIPADYDPEPVKMGCLSMF